MTRGATARILVTGGAGFIGSHLCDRLLADGHEVWCLDNFDTGSEENLGEALKNPAFHLIRGDIRDGLPEIAVEQIYNLACPASPRHYQRDAVGTMRTSILGALHVLEYGRTHGARIFQASTSEVYGDPDVHPQPEDYVGAVNCVGRRACYDEGKRAAETLFYDYNRQYAVEIRVARLFNTYGPRMSAGDGRVIPNFVTQALTGEPITVYGSGTQTRSFCYISDMIDGFIALMNSPGDRVGPVNLGNPIEFSMRALAELVLEQTGSSSSLVYEALPDDDPKVRRPDTTQARTLLGWLPQVQLHAGLEQTIAWHRADLGLAVPDDGRPSERPDTGERRPVVAILGGGPAGLTAAYQLAKRSQRHRITVFEALDKVGGIARTEVYKNFRFDLGGHRFFTRVKEVEALWREVLPNDFITRPRLSRIFYKGKYFSYPLKLFNALYNVGVYEAVRILLSYVKWRFQPYAEEVNFQQWVTNRFGGRLFWHFFKTYTEKVWGMPCTEIQADWAAQRIRNLSLRKAVMNAVTGANDTTSLIESFEYPRLGPGMMWEAFRDAVRHKGGEVRMRARIAGLHHDGSLVRAIDVVKPDDPEGSVYRFEAEYFISSMPLAELVLAMTPVAPPQIIAAAKRLKYRDFLIVTLILDHADPFPDNWIYIHSPNVKVGRIQNFRSWSEDMVPEPDKSSIGMEYFCMEGDELWNSSDEQLLRQAANELEELGLAKATDVVDGTVIRQPKAYPVYDSEYREALDLIRGWLARFPNLQVVGRNGMHRYNNQDHSMLTAMLAIDNLLGGLNDLWSVNVERTYHEDIEAAPDLTHAHDRWR